MTDDSAAPARRKPNSPKAPGIDLRSAVAEVAKVYSRYSHGSFTKGELASALGMSAGSGTFLSKSAALREYGLIEDTVGGERVSDIFRSVYQAPLGSNEVKRAAMVSLRHSPALERLLQQFDAKVPDERALSLRLETQERFNADRAKVVATAFRRSLMEYGLIDQAGNLLPVRDDEVTSQVETSPHKADDTDEDSEPGPETGLFRVEIPLGAGRRAVLHLPDDFAQPDARRVNAVLRAYVEDTVD